ncbi:Phage-related protein, tail component [Sodalis praecaptivus]|uniref:Phage-related protein, tail component n=1 Tax=Sodalis praecaptivus TaxID=1239307 RepID=W0HZE1_9GAMM|nr:host specificity protein J [Sodalis praecaptivus]AHF77887.1 Phage-related protein, tail component [Sodalis praecaptivus]
MGGGSSSSASTPTEKADNLKSTQRLQIVDLISEGPIYGPVDGLKSFYLNDTPVLDSNGNANFSGVDASWTPGTQDQTYLPGYSDIENEVGVSTVLLQASPIVKTVTDSDVDRVRVTLGVQSLVEQDDDGNLGYTSVNIMIQVQNQSEQWITEETVNIDGKISGQYLESHIIDAPGYTPWSFRLVRVEPDSTSSKLQNSTYFSSYTEIIDAKLNYPNSVVVGTTIDYTGQFSGIPTRTYDMKGLMVNVPDNYDPDTRTYSGIWSGGFKLAWTNNPAWVFYDLVTNERYGLGKRLGSFGCDKFAMFAVAQYCDVLVDDGYGGQEPRFTCNVYITDQRQAYDVLYDLSSCFRGMPIWDGLQMTCVQDRPSDPVWQYTNANVVDGTFKYSSSARKARHTAIQVEWVNPDNGWSSDIEYVSDDTLIARYGLNVTKVTAFGCTSRGQANRVGRWILKTEQLETQTVVFDAGREGLVGLPGDIITVADNDYASARMGGRVIAFTGRQVTLDAPLELAADETAYFSYLNDLAKLVKIRVIGQSNDSIITLESEPAGIKKWGIFTLSKSTLATRYFRIMAIAENTDDGTYTVTALQHEPQKESVVDEGAQFEGDPTTNNTTKIPAIEHLTVIPINDSTLAQAKITWTTATVNRNITFDVTLYRETKLVSKGNTAELEYYFNGLDVGDYLVGVRGRDEQGRLGDETQVEMVIGAPAAPTSIEVEGGFFQITITPHISAPKIYGTQFEFWFSSEEIININDIESEADYLGTATYWIKDSLKPGITYWFYVRSVNAYGKSIFVEARGEVDSDPAGMIDYIDNSIKQSETYAQLIGQIDTNTDAIIENALANDADVYQKWQQYGENRAGIVEVRTAQADANSAFAEYQQLVTARLNANEASIETKATTVFNADGTGSAIYSVKAGVNLNGTYYGAGMSIGAEANGSVVKSLVLFNADQFGIYNANSGTYDLAFVAQGGQVFINSAYIEDASITNAKIGNYIQSTNFVDLQSGWKLTKDGDFQINGGSGGRLTIEPHKISVYDGNNAIRVKIGNLE